jgi:hypothetical protein
MCNLHTYKYIPRYIYQKQLQFFRTIAIFVVVSTNVFHAVFINMFLIYLHTKFPNCISNYSLTIAMKLKRNNQ